MSNINLEYISYKEIQNALLTAIDQKNKKMITRLMRMHQDLIEGTIEELSKIYKKEVLEYIIKSHDIEPFNIYNSQKSRKHSFKEGVIKDKIDNLKISRIDIQNAMLIAIFEIDFKLSSKLMEMYQEHIEGDILVLSDKYDIELLEYIRNNIDVEAYITMKCSPKEKNDSTHVKK